MKTGLHLLDGVDWAQCRVTIQWDRADTEKAMSLFGYYEPRRITEERAYEIVPADHVIAEEQRVVEDLLLEKANGLTLESIAREFLRTDAGAVVAAQHLRAMAVRNELSKLLPWARIGSITWTDSLGERGMYSHSR
jgi:hypothetical protein